MTNQALTYPSNTWQSHQQQQRQGPSQQQQQQQQHYAQQPRTSGFGQPQTTVGIGQQMDQGMMSRAPPYSSPASGVLERQPYPLSTHNIGGIGPSNQIPYTWAPGGFEIQRQQSTHTPNFNINSLQRRHSGGDFEPGPHLLDQEDEGVMSRPSMSQGYGGFKSNSCDD